MLGSGRGFEPPRCTVQIVNTWNGEQLHKNVECDGERILHLRACY